MPLAALTLALWSAAFIGQRGIASQRGGATDDLLGPDRVVADRTSFERPGLGVPAWPDWPACSCPNVVAPADQEQEDAAFLQGYRIEVTLTRYVCSYEGLPAGLQAGYCGTTASGRPVLPGSAACGFVSPRSGVVFTVVGDPSATVWRCEDTGLGGYWWVDLWFYSWAEAEAWREACINCYPWRIE